MGDEVDKSVVNESAETKSARGLQVLAMEPALCLATT